MDMKREKSVGCGADSMRWKSDVVGVIAGAEALLMHDGKRCQFQHSYRI